MLQSGHLSNLHKLNLALSSYDKPALVIGGAGYIGSLLVRRLLYRGQAVRVLDRLDFGDDSVRPLYSNPRFELIDADLRDGRALQRALEGVDSVVHLGAIVGDAACAADEREAVEVNVEAVGLLTRLSKVAGVRRLAFASTCSVYGTSSETANEDSPTKPVSLYAQTKIEAEEFLRRSQDDLLKPVILRIGTVFGWSPRPRFDLVANLLTAKAFFGHDVTVFNGERWRPFVHVDDVARGFELALDAPLSRIEGQLLNLGSSRANHRLRDVAEAIRAVRPRARIVERVNDDARDYQVDFSRVERVLGFQPTVSLQAGIAEVDRALCEGEVNDYTAARYHNHRCTAKRATHALAAV